MKRRDPPDIHKDTAMQAAYLRAVAGMKQSGIGDLLGGLSQSQVSRLLKRAEDNGWLEQSFRFTAADLTTDQMEELRRLGQPHALLDALQQVDSPTGVVVRGVSVVDSGGRGTEGRALDSRRRRFGRAAATRIDELLLRSAVFAVTWGRTLSHVVDGLQAVPTLRSKGRSIQFVPVCGEPLEKDSNKDTSSHLARRLHTIVCWPTKPPPPSLMGVPALIPRKFVGEKAKVIREFVEQAGNYREIFGTRAPLIAAVDSLLTSAGPSNGAMGFIHHELLEAGSTEKRKLTTARLGALVAGDIGGVLIPRRSLADRREVQALNAMWTGARLEHLERIARQADRTRRPGVILVAVGVPGRAEIVAEAVRWGLVNQLIIDRQLADGLKTALTEPPDDRARR